MNNSISKSQIPINLN